MHIKPSYNQIKNLLNSFLKYKISEYDKYRNFAYFTEDTFKNVSGLSVFISRGLIKEKHLLKTVINSQKTSDKFIQEIFWRVYWQGWLENYPSTWVSYKRQIKEIEENNYTAMNFYKLATSGKTKIEPFDEWVRILKNTGYLHNHVRMWFASIWIYYLGIPWQLGAKFFYEHLLDGDVASNLLSWRWVAGIQTKGKKYIATEKNINKFTFNRYRNLKLPKIKNIKIDDEENNIGVIKYSKLKRTYNKSALLIFENNLNLELFNFLKKNIKILVLIRFNIASLKKSKDVLEFHKKLYEEFKKKIRVKKVKYYEINLPSQTTELIDIMNHHSIENIVYEYIRCGYEKDIMLNFIAMLKKDIKVYDVLDNFYINSWQYCEKGFFKFKDKIPLLLNSLR